MSEPLSVPVIGGNDDITRILYPVPTAVPAGIVAEIIPEFADEVNVPIFTGEAKLPDAFDN